VKDWLQVAITAIRKDHDLRHEWRGIGDDKRIVSFVSRYCERDSSPPELRCYEPREVSKVVLRSKSIARKIINPKLAILQHFAASS